MYRENNIIPVKNHKLQKDYFRDQLLKLIDKTDNKPIVIKAWFQWTGYLKQYCFRDPTPWIGDKEVAHRLCQHLNVRIRDVNCILEERDDRRWFFLVGFPDSYRHFGMRKGCLRLVNWNGLPQIFSEEEYDRYKDRLKNTYILRGYKKDNVRDIRAE